METLQRPVTNGRVHTVDLRAPRRRPRWFFAILALLVIVAIVAPVIVVRSRADAVTYQTAPVTTGSLAQTVTASGTVNPQNTIDVGTQVSGTISSIDVDYNSKVKQGQVLAKIDPTTLQAALAQAQAQLAQAQAQAQAASATAAGGPASIEEAPANAQAAGAGAQEAKADAAAAKEAIASAQTTVTKDQAALSLAQQTLSRDQSLLAQGYVAQSAVDADRSNEVAAQTALQAAQVAVVQAQAQEAASQAQTAQTAAQAQAQDAQANVQGSTSANQAASAQAAQAAIGIDQAQVATAEQNLRNATITSPVNGTVIARDVSIGQTVAASLQTPTLFAIAQDLSKMEVDLAVGEPDIGNVRAGDPVSFTVLAYPNRTFTGTVEQVRKDPTTVNNVVTYDTVVDVPNADGALLPGMTANATIQTEHVDNAQIVPLAALSFAPPAGSIAHGTRKHAVATHASPAATAAKTGSSPWGATGTTSSGAVTPGSHGRIFVLQNGKLRPIPVTVGLVTDTQATITPLRGTIPANAAVVTGDNAPAHVAAARPAGNPLTGQSHFGGGFGGAR